MIKKYDFDALVDRRNTNCVKWDLREEIFGTGDVIPLWVADMDFKTPDFIIEALQKRLNHEILGYHFHPKSFFEAAKNWLARRSDWKVNIDDMTFSPGIVPAINIIVNALTEKGDKIMINKPVYHPFMYAVNDHNRQLINSPLKEINRRYCIDFEDFEEKLADGVKMYILCSPHNPVGRVWSRDELQRLGTLCVKHHVVIVADEIHSDLIIKPHRHIPLSSISQKIAQQTITFLAPSKTFNLAGVFTSIVHSENPELLNAFKNFSAKMHLDAGNIFGDIALEAAYMHGDNWLDQMLAYVEENFDFVIDFLKKNIPLITTTKPEGTYLMWLDCRKFGFSPKELDDFMIKQAGLGFNSGYIFGEEGEGFMRLNAATPRSILQKSMRQLHEALLKNKLVKD